MSFKDHFEVTRTKVAWTPELAREHKFRERCAVTLTIIAMVTEVIAITRGPAWGLWVTALLFAMAFWVYFHVTISIEIPVIERWKARRQHRG